MQCLTPSRPTSLQIQQTLRLHPLLRPPSFPPPGPGSLPREDGGPASVKAVRHGCAQLHREDERHREQAHRRCVLQAAARSHHVHVEDGGDRQRGEFILLFATLCIFWTLNVVVAIVLACVCAFLTPGRQVHRTRTHPRWPRHDNRPCVSRHAVCQPAASRPE